MTLSISRSHHHGPWPRRAIHGPAFASMLARQRPPHVGLGQAELPGDLRWFDANLECGANRVQLARRQMDGRHLGPRLDRGLN
jgi:hypothetical protein